MSQNLSVLGRQKMNEFVANTAKAYGVQPGETYAATPSVAQTLNDKIIVDGNWLLNLVNVLGVGELKGEKILMGLTSSVTSRTDTSGSGERTPRNLIGLDNKGYELFPTESDVAITYGQIDAWAKFKDFAERYNRMVRRAIGNDRVKIGWHGTSVATTSDMVANPNLSDVNKGWLQLLREYNSGEQVVTGTVGAPIVLGGTDFPNLDTLVFDCLNRIEEQHRDDPDLVVMISRDIMQAAKGAYFEAQGNTPTEKEKLRERMVVETYGSLPAYVPPYFPAGTILVTSFENLSIYYQDDSWRRQIKDKPEKNRYENFNSRNEGYVLEHEGKASLIEGITFPE